MQEALPPLTFGYSAFDPARRRFEPVTGAGLADQRAERPDHGAGRPARRRAARRRGARRRPAGTGATPASGRFDLPRPLAEAPPQSLGDPGVQVLDADGDGRADLLGQRGRCRMAGYFPMTFAGRVEPPVVPALPAGAPASGFGDPSVKLVDLDGDGLTDVLRSGQRLECFFNDRDPGWRGGAPPSSDGAGAAGRPGRSARSGWPT